MSTKISNNIKAINLIIFFICILNQNFVNCVKNDIGAITYLKRYGYMNESMGSANLISESSFEEAIKYFQRFIGLNETGFLDQETVKMMSQPRCGNKDRNGHIEGAKRRRRYALQGSKWRKTDLTYRISKYSKKLKKNVVDREIARAFELWSNVTLLKFIPKKEGRVNIDIKFVTLNHLDGDDFDGRGGVLAHAYFPQYGGDVHFDDDEDWSVNSYAGTNLFQVACHEFGHSLGLGHSSVRESLMAPFYQRYKPNFQLHKDDVLGIQSLYGESYNTFTTTVFPSTFVTERSTTTTTSPIDTDEKNDIDNDLCLHGSIDAVTRTVSGRTFVFKGDHYWKIETNGLAEGYPRKISTDWDGLPGNLDAAITWADGKTFFFKGDKYWRFFDMKMSSGYPKEISVGFAGVPNNIDAAFVWSGNGKTYFFKGSEYWRFDSKSDPPVSSRYPKPIKNWVGLPNKIDAAFKWENGLTYFFKGTEYYRFNDADFEVDVKAKPPFPRQTSVWWFDCKSPALGSYSRRKPISLTQFRFRNNNKNDLDSSSSGSLSSSIKPLTSSLLTSSSLSVDRSNDKDWIRLGHPDLDQTSIAAAYYAENSSINNFNLNYIFLTIANIMFLITLKIF